MSRSGRAFYHLLSLDALFRARPAGMPPEVARDELDAFLREGWRRRGGEFVTHVETSPALPEGWQLVLTDKGLCVLYPSGHLQPATHILLLDRDYMDSQDSPRPGEPLHLGRPIPVIYAGRPLDPARTVELASSDVEKIRDFEERGYDVIILPTAEEEIEIATDRAAEVLRHEPDASAPELYRKAVETKPWISMRRPTPRSRHFERIVDEARKRAGVPAKPGRPRR